MNRPTIDRPETHLTFSFEESPLLVKVDAQDIADVALHGIDVGPVLPRGSGELEAEFESLGLVICSLELGLGIIDVGN